MFILVMTA